MQQDLKIAFCLIIKDDSELDKLKQTIASVEGFVYEYHITANGKNVKEIEKYCEDNGFDYSYLKWDKDFSKQRNFNFKQVSKDIDYILWLDAGDLLVGGEYLQRLVELSSKKEMDVVYLSYWYGCRFNGTPSYQNLKEVELYHQRERLIKPNRIKWVGRIHETPIWPEGQKNQYTNVVHTPEEPHKYFEIAVMHTDATRDSEKENTERTNRNREMLELQLEDERKANKVDPRTILYLMKIYAIEDDKETLLKCIRLGEEYLNNSGWDEERATCCSLIADCFGKLDENQKAKDLLFGAVNEWPHDKILYLKLASSCFNLKQYKQMRHWLDVAKTMKIDKTTAGNRNLIQDKFLTYQLEAKYAFNATKNIDVAYKYFKKLTKIENNQNNREQLDYIYDKKRLNDACKNFDGLIKYLAEIGENEDSIANTMNNLSHIFGEIPFFSRLKNKYGKPRVWKDNEICYFANFGNKHFEQWSPDNLKTGIGGSETAVIQLAKEWVKKGYKVVVYGDPKKEGSYDGVLYLKYYRFNIKDKFNIFVQWRSGYLANKISAKKFYVDLHDVWNQTDYFGRLSGIDKIMVKSNYHRELAPAIDQDKFEIISNGI